MKDTPPPSQDREPVGIIISSGEQTEHAPAILAFVWGAAPESKPLPKGTKAA
jgi:hypothetical protein